MNNLFDTVHQNALNLINIKVDKLISTRHREKSRPGSMLGVDFKLANKEKRKLLDKEMKKRDEKYTLSISTCKFSFSL